MARTFLLHVFTSRLLHPRLFHSSHRLFIFVRLTRLIQRHAKMTMWLHPTINYAPVPIFGRVNLEQLNDSAKNGNIAAIQEIIGESETDQKKLATYNYLVKKNVDDAILITSIKNKKKIKKSGRKSLSRSSNLYKLHKTVSFKKSSRAKSRARQIHIPEANIIKPPELLTEVRAQWKKENSPRHVQCFQDTTTEPPNKKQTPLKKKSKTVPERNNAAKFSLSPICQNRKNLDHLDKISKPSQLRRVVSDLTSAPNKNYRRTYNNGMPNLYSINKQIKAQKEQEDFENRKFTVFKANPIRKYLPLPQIPKPKLTIPESPKFSKRRALCATPR